MILNAIVRSHVSINNDKWNPGAVFNKAKSRIDSTVIWKDVLEVLGKYETQHVCQKLMQICLFYVGG